jgi:hypothetical protein
MSDPKNVDMCNGALMWFTWDDVKADDDHSDISSEGALSDSDDDRPELLNASFCSQP